MHIFTGADGDQASYPHYPQFVHKVIPKVIHTNVQASQKLCTYSQEQTVIRRVIHTIHNSSTKLSPKLSTQTPRQTIKLCTYPQERAAISRVIHIIHNLSTKLSPKLSTLSRKTRANHPENQYLVVTHELSTIYGFIHKVIHIFALKRLRLSLFGEGNTTVWAQ